VLDLNNAIRQSLVCLAQSARAGLIKFLNFIGNPSPTLHETVFLILISCWSLTVKSLLRLHVFKTVIGAYSPNHILGYFYLLHRWPAPRTITSLSSVEIHGLPRNNPQLIYVEYLLRIASNLGTSYTVDIA